MWNLWLRNSCHDFHTLWVNFLDQQHKWKLATNLFVPLTMWISVSVQCNNLERWHDLPYLLEKLHSLKQYANGSWNSSSNHLKKKQVLELTLRDPFVLQRIGQLQLLFEPFWKWRQGLEFTLRSLCPSKDRLASVWTTRKFVRVVCKPDSHARVH